MQALSRIFLDNFENVQSSWVTQGPKIGQIALKFGANDFGSVMMEENVVSSAGTTFRLECAEISSTLFARPATNRIAAAPGISCSTRVVLLRKRPRSSDGSCCSGGVRTAEGAWRQTLADIAATETLDGGDTSLQMTRPLSALERYFSALNV